MLTKVTSFEKHLRRNCQPKGEKKKASQREAGKRERGGGEGRIEAMKTGRDRERKRDRDNYSINRQFHVVGMTYQK